MNREFLAALLQEKVDPGKVMSAIINFETRKLEAKADRLLTEAYSILRAWESAAHRKRREP